MVGNLVEDVDVIKSIGYMNKLKISIILTCITVLSYGQTSDTTSIFKKRILENTEVDFMMSYYSQDGDNASVTGGIGTEKLTDVTPTFTVSIPLNDDDIISIDAGVSAYTSASSSNLDPFDNRSNGNLNASPWVESSGASGGDSWKSISGLYTHHSDDRNKIWSANLSISSEYDYSSLGFGGSYTYLFNKKNTEVSAKVNTYIDSWRPVYPSEIRSYSNNQSLFSGLFSGINIYNEDGSLMDKNGTNRWKPIQSELIVDKGRNTYSASFSFSQILSKNTQISLFFDVVQQSGWLANPMQRVYFKDKENFYVGNPDNIGSYTTPGVTNIFMLGDDIERLPDTRLKIPIGMRLNHYINQSLTLRTYYRFYSDDWGITSHTIQVEAPIKIGQYFTLIPSYRNYSQTAADYFAPFNQHLSTSEFYTSDYDLSKFTTNQYGLGIRYTDLLTEKKIWKLGLKQINLKFSMYDRSTGLNAQIVTAGVKFVLDQ